MADYGWGGITATALAAASAAAAGHEGGMHHEEGGSESGGSDSEGGTSHSSAAASEGGAPGGEGEAGGRRDAASSSGGPAESDLESEEVPLVVTRFRAAVVDVVYDPDTLRVAAAMRALEVRRRGLGGKVRV